MAVKKKSIEISIDNNHMQIKSIEFDADLITSQLSEYVFVRGKKVDNFIHVEQSTESVLHNELGEGRRINVLSKSGFLTKQASYTIYNEYPQTIVTDVMYTNIGSDALIIEGYVNNHYCFDYAMDTKLPVPFYAYQGSSSEERHDWIRSLPVGFEQQNFMGMNNSDYGGGTPVIDIWNQKVGIAIGHLALEQKEISLPIHIKEHGAELSIKDDEERVLDPKASFSTLTTFTTIHTGDCFYALEHYKKMLVALGLKFEPITDAAYEATWCAWGYERDFTLKQIYEAIPKVKEMGFKWVCLDDGYQLEEGDLELDPIKFPNGEQDMRDFVDHIHHLDLKAQLWWVPLAVDPKAKLYEEHPEWLLLDEDGNKQDITWWDCYTLCPAYQPVVDDLRKQLKRIFVDWNYDGLKIDGQHLNSAPKCHNPVHNHASPSDSIKGMSDVMKMIYDVAREYKPDATIMYCPCGCSYSIFTMPYYNMPVASDPESSFQIRSKGKVFKALMGRNAPYHGDHVELSDNESDFASTVGTGAIIDTKFTWPIGSMKCSVLRPDLESPFELNSSVECEYTHWLTIYEERQLAKGQYMGELYSYGFDFPETHVIYKDNVRYFSFYDDNNAFAGEVEFRGLEDEEIYQVYDYVNKKQLGTVSKNKPKLDVEFTRNLLVELTTR
jgi:alpha-galactosidase